MIAQPQGGFAAPANAPVAPPAPIFQNQVVIDRLGQLCKRVERKIVHADLQVQLLVKGKI